MMLSHVSVGFKIFLVERFLSCSICNSIRRSTKTLVKKNIELHFFFRWNIFAGPGLIIEHPRNSWIPGAAGKLFAWNIPFLWLHNLKLLWNLIFYLWSFEIKLKWWDFVSKLYVSAIKTWRQTKAVAVSWQFSFILNTSFNFYNCSGTSCFRLEKKVLMCVLPEGCSEKFLCLFSKKCSHLQDWLEERCCKHQLNDTRFFLSCFRYFRNINIKCLL